MQIAIVHPDLGIGGAERLIVDAALQLQQRGHKVIIYTSHHNRDHCFPETLQEIPVQVIGDWLPRSLFGGYFTLLCAALRALWLSLCLWLMGVKVSVILADQISFHIPILRLCCDRLVFYCHFPDKWLAPPSTSWLRTGIYRRLLDWLEEKTIRKKAAVYF